MEETKKKIAVVLWIAGLVVLILGLVGILPSCTEQQRAKQFGGTMTVELTSGTKLVNATWKNSELWYLVRPMKEGEQPETYEFLEKSSFGVMQGRVVFKEISTAVEQRR